jgi:predicted DNA-binding ribbon-helix-helix protein
MSAAAHRLPDAAPCDSRLAPRFRVLSIAGARRAFRLEAVFWSALAAIAALNRRPLAAEIAARLTDAPDAANHSALLRAGAVADLLELWETARAHAAKPMWTKVLAAMPGPAFAATGSGRLVALNAPMRGLLERHGLAPAPLAQASVELAAGALGQLSKAHLDQPVVCNAVFRAERSRAACRVRIVLAEPGQTDSRLIIGFPEPV